jgi:hypothetical protein
MQPTRLCRNSRGSMLADSAVGMWLVMSGTILGTLLLLNVGGWIYYKEKLGFIANTAATYGCTLPVNAARDGLVITSVNQSLTSMGFDPANTTINIQDLTVTGRPAVRITLSCTISSLLAAKFSSVIPSSMTISDSAVASQRVWYMGDCSFVGPNGQNFTCPMANATGALPLPSDGLQAWTVTILGMSRSR